MADFETKLKLGRKLANVDAATASNNQASALFRYNEAGQDGHVSITIESDSMTGEDVAALFQFLQQRNILAARGCKTWLNQPQASIEKFGDTTKWKGVDLKPVVDLITAGLPVRDTAPTSSGEAQGKLREAQVRLSELEKKVEELRAALQ